MTRTLVLTRHAKSDWDNPALDDHDRPLNPRGRADAPRIGRWIAARASPDLVLVSSAQRALDTWTGIAPALSAPPAVQVLPRLYHASPDAMAQVLRRADAGTVLMIGHNPGIAEFAALLLARRPDDPGFARYPTAATLIARFEIDDWGALRFGTGHLVDFTVPRAIPD